MKITDLQAMAAEVQKARYPTNAYLREEGILLRMTEKTHDCIRMVTKEHVITYTEIWAVHDPAAIMRLQLQTMATAVAKALDDYLNDTRR